MIRKFLASGLPVFVIYALCTEFAWASSDVLCNVSSLQSFLTEKLLLSTAILAIGITLTIMVIKNDGAENSHPETRNRARKGRVKVLLLVSIAIFTKSSLSLLSADGVWGDVILTFNSALAGVYAAQGWPTNSGNENNNKPQS